MSTLKEIANHLGLSYSTVSLAFKPDSRISEKTRKRVLQYAAQIKYQPNLIARSLKQKRSNTVGIIIPSIENSFYMQVLQRIEVSLKSFDYRLIVTFLQNGVTSEHECLEIMFSSKVDALIILPENRINETSILAFAKERPVIQLFSAPYDELDSVVMDDKLGVWLGAVRLLQLGHRRILYMGGPDRVEGFINAIKEYPDARDTIHICTKFLDESATMEIIKSLAPTAILAVAKMAERVWDALAALGLSVPDDVSFIAYDDVQWVRMLRITAIAHDYDIISDELVKLLIERLTSANAVNAEPKKIVINPFLVERLSTKPIAHN